LDDPASRIGDDHAIFQGVGYTKQGQRRFGLSLLMKGDNVLQVNIGDGVATNNEKGLVQESLGILDTARRPQGSLLNRIANVHAQALAVSEVTLYDLGHEMQGDDDVGDALPFEQIQDVSHDRLGHHGHHRFGPANGQRAQPRALAAGHHNRFHVCSFP
jgi:hypothetical protein